MDTAITSANELNFNLLKSYRKTEHDKNVFFSPFSITTALAMLYGGTKENTKKQIETLLNLKEDDQLIHQSFQFLFNDVSNLSDNVIMNVGNMFAVDKNYDVLPDYVNNLKKNYNVDFKQYDFQSHSDESREEINQWIESATQGKIKNLFPSDSISFDTKLVLANAVYFKGMWRMPFNKSNTTQTPFYTISKEKVMVDMMYRKDDNYGYFSDPQLKASFLEIPYVGNDYSMVIILPDDQYGLPDIENNISTSDLHNAFDKMHKRRNLHLSLPKFKLEESFNLKKHLIDLGMTDAFSDVADLSGISGKQDLCISAALHKAFVEVNEEGTEAAAATGLVAVLKCLVMPEHFIVDHPFMFLIRNKNGIILFTGSIYRL